MPRIPLYQQRVSIPGEAASTPGSLAVAGAEGEGIAKLGATGMKVTNEFADIIARQNEVLRKQGNIDAAMKTGVQINDIARVAKDEYDTESNKLNSFDALEAYNKNFATKQDEKFNGFYSGVVDQDQKHLIQQQAINASGSLKDHIAVKSASKLKEIILNGVDEVIRDATESARRSEDFNTITSDFNRKIGLYLSTGGIDSQVAEDKMVIGHRLITEAYLDSLPAPQLAEALKDSKYTKYLPEATYRRLEERAVNLGKDQLVTDNLIKLKIDYPDIQKRIDRIESTDFLKTLGPNGAEIQNTLMSYALREWQVQEKNYKEFSDNKVGKISVAIYNGQTPDPQDLVGLRPPELALIEKINDYQIRQDRAELAAERAASDRRASDRRAARYEEKIAAKEKSDGIAGGIILKITNGDPIDVTKDIYAQIPNGLNTGEANRLVTMATKVQKDPTFKLGADVIEKAFRAGAVDAPTRGRMLLDLRQQVEDEKATGKRIIDIAEEIVKPKKENAVKKWIANLFTGEGPLAIPAGTKVKPVMGVSQPSQADLEFTAKKYGITVDEVLKRMKGK